MIVISSRILPRQTSDLRSLDLLSNALPLTTLQSLSEHCFLHKPYLFYGFIQIGMLDIVVLFACNIFISGCVLEHVFLNDLKPIVSLSGKENMQNHTVCITPAQTLQLRTQQFPTGAATPLRLPPRESLTHQTALSFSQYQIPQPYSSTIIHKHTHTGRDHISAPLHVP